MSVCNGFMIKIYGFMHSLRTFWHVPLRMPLSHGMEIEESEDRQKMGRPGNEATEIASDREQ